MTSYSVQMEENKSTVDSHASLLKDLRGAQDAKRTAEELRYVVYDLSDNARMQGEKLQTMEADFEKLRCTALGVPCP